jgi:hypothetical protein
MPTTCATCRAEVGDAAACPRCGTVVLSPQSSDQSSDQSSNLYDDQARDPLTDTAERRPPPAPVVPAPAAGTPAPARYPLYADDLDVVAHSGPPTEGNSYDDRLPTLPPPPTTYGDQDEDERRGGIAAAVAWAVVALLLVLVALGGVWLLFSPGEEDEASEPPAQTRSQPGEQSGDPSNDTAASGPPASEPPASDPPSELDYSGDAVDLAATSTASAPRTAPPNADVFGNRTTYVAANMLDGLPDTCWRVAGDATGMELTFRLASPTLVTRVGMINGYAKNAVVGGRNLNWYLGNRRVLSAQWVFDDGTTVDQPFGATKQMQTRDLDEPVVTSTVTLRLMAVSYIGTGRSARDYTAVSEVALVGVPGV